MNEVYIVVHYETYILVTLFVFGIFLGLFGAIMFYKAVLSWLGLKVTVSSKND